MSNNVYQTGVNPGVAANSFFGSVFGDTVDITFALLTGFLTALLMFWVLGVNMKDSMQCGILAVGGIYISKSMFDSFFADSRVALRTSQLRPGYEQSD